MTVVDTRARSSHYKHTCIRHRQSKTQYLTVRGKTTRTCNCISRCRWNHRCISNPTIQRWPWTPCWAVIHWEIGRTPSVPAAYLGNCLLSGPPRARTTQSCLLASLTVQVLGPHSRDTIGMRWHSDGRRAWHQTTEWERCAARAWPPCLKRRNVCVIPWQLMTSK